ncbi:MAG: ABC transporter substrate-binding protein [Coriobacteriales bacterium]|jgi:iron complex transport system substrate-binding protein
MHDARISNALASTDSRLSRRSFVAACATGLAALAVAGAASGLRGGVARASEQGDTITIEALGADEKPLEVEVPYDPQRIAILDFAAFDIIGTLGLADRVVGCASTTVDYLNDYLGGRTDVAALGTIKEADLEATMGCEPDIIFIGGRLAKSYDDLVEIAPVVLLTTDEEIGLVESVRKNATTIASIFGLEDQIADKMAGFDAEIETIKAIGDEHTAIIGMVTSGSFNALANDGRLSLIVNECGFTNVAVGTDLIQESGGHGGSAGSASADGSAKSEGHGHGAASSAADSNAAAASGSADGSSSTLPSGSTNPHGEEASFETIVSLDPDYIFVMDRDAAIGTEGAQYARDVMDNELVNSTRAYADGHIVYLEHPAVWYTVEGGITALEVMIEDLNAGLGIE